MPEVVDMKCPGCSAPVDFSTTKCKYCGRPIVISSFSTAKSISAPDLAKLKRGYSQDLEIEPDNAEMHKSLGLVFLAQGIHDKAREHLDQAIELGFDDSEIYYYTAIALLKGKKPGTLSRPAVEKAKSYLQAAIDMEPRGIYWLLMAYINYDYYARKHLRVSPDYLECLQNIVACGGVSAMDRQALFEMLGQQEPQKLTEALDGSVA